MEDVAIFYGHMINLWQCGILWGHLVYLMAVGYNFPRFGMLHREKSGNPGTR
jgi:hypothetical protein